VLPPTHTVPFPPTRDTRRKHGMVIRVWSADGAPLRILPTDNQVMKHASAICLGHHGRLFVSDYQGFIHMLALDTGAYLGRLRGGQSESMLCLNPRNGRLFSSQEGGGFLYW
jgi:hypothetical protein